MKSGILFLVLFLVALTWILATTCGVSETAEFADLAVSGSAEDDWDESEPDTAPFDAEPERTSAPLPLSGEPEARGGIPPPADQIHGRVLLPDGAGAGDAVVRIWALGDLPVDEPSASTISQADGGFRFDGPLRGDFRLAAEHGRNIETRFPVPAGDFVEIRLGSGCLIEGSIRCASHEHESFEGQFWLVPGMFMGHPLMTAVINSDGSFAFASIQPGSYVLAGKIQGHVFDPFNTINLLAWGASTTIIVHAEAGLTLEGQVVDELTNLPIAGANVMVGPMNRVDQLTDEDGRFRIAEIPPSAEEWEDMVTVHGSAPGYESLEVPFEPGSPCILRLKRQMPLPLQITGRILDHRLQPLAGFRLHAEGRRSNDENGWMIPALQRWIESGLDGGFQIEWDQGMSTTIWIEDPAGGSHLLFLGTVNADRQLGDLVLAEPQTWHIRITDAAGQPVAGAKVSRSQGLVSLPQEELGGNPILVGPVPFSSPNRTTDSFGRCHISSGPMEDEGFSVDYGDQGHWFFPALSSSDAEQVFVLEDLRRVTGRVQDSSGAPYADAILLILNPDIELDANEDPMSRAEWCFLSQAGTFRFDGRYPSEVTLLLQLHSSAAGVIRTDEVVLNSEPIVLVVPELVPCTGQVQDSAGRPLADATVLVVLEDGQQHPVCRTAVDGRFSFGLLPEARAQLLAQDEDKRRSEPLDVSTGRTEVVLRIKE